MEVNQAREILKLTEQEVDAIKTYMGFAHAGINILADMDPEKMIELSNKGWVLPSTKEDLKRNIDCFINIYSAMLKENKEVNTSLYRGTTNKELDNLQDTYDTILSTTTDEEVAKRFTEYNNGAIERIKLGENVPYIDASKYLGENSANENEIIVAPFTKVTDKKLIFKDKNFTYYDVTLKKADLPDIDETILKRNENELIESFPIFYNDISDFKDTLQKREYLEERLSKAIDSEDYRNIARDLDFVETINKNLDKHMNNYKSKMKTFLQGKCREKERTINLAKDTLKIENDRENREKQEQYGNFQSSEIRKYVDNSGESCKFAKVGIAEEYQYLLDSENYFMKISQILGIEFSKPKNNDDCMRLVQEIQLNIDKIEQKLRGVQISENESLEAVNSKFTRVSELTFKIDTAQKKSKELTKITEDYKNAELKNVKAKLYEKVHKTIKDAKLQKLSEEYNRAQDEKTGIFGRINGKEKLKQETLSNIDLKMKLVSEKEIEADPENNYSVREMMVDLYAFSKYEFNGQFTKEMSELAESISNIFTSPDGSRFNNSYVDKMVDNNICTDDYFNNIFDNRINSSNLPVNQKGKHFSYKSQAELLKNENKRLMSYAKGGKNIKVNDFYGKTSKRELAISNFIRKLNEIELDTYDDDKAKTFKIRRVEKTEERENG